MSDSRLLAARRGLAAATGKTPRASLTPHLHFTGHEVHHDFTAAPVAFWASAIWDRSGPLTIMQLAWRRQMVAMGQRPSWAAVQGPAGAVRCSLSRASWTWPAWHVFCSASGVLLNCFEVCPLGIKAHLLSDTRRILWETWIAECPQRTYLGKAIFLKPLMDFVKKAAKAPRANSAPTAVVAADAGTEDPAGEGDEAQLDDAPVTRASGIPALARRLITKGHWTQSSMLECGWAEDDICLACQVEPGTEHHRCYMCTDPAMRLRRLQANGQTWTRAAVMDTTFKWTRAWFPDPAQQWRWLPTVANVKFAGVHGAFITYTGDVVVDGSLLGAVGPWASSGWAASQLCSDTGSVTHVAYCPAEARIPEQKRIKRAEMLAAEFVLRHGIPPLRIHTDHLAIVRGIAKGKKWCTSAARAHADVWARIWFHLDDDPEAAGISFYHTKAHRSQATIRALPPRERRIAEANAVVDLWAKKAAADDGGFLAHARRLTIEQEAQKVFVCLTYLVSLYLHSEAWPDRAPLPPRKPKLQLARLRPLPAVRHDVLHLGPDAAVCRVCAVAARSVSTVARLARRPCAGPALLARPVEDAYGILRIERHVILSLGQILFCLRCGAYTASSRLVLLASPCRGEPANSFARYVLKRLLAGSHPKSGAWVGEPRPVAADAWVLAQAHFARL